MSHTPDDGSTRKRLGILTAWILVIAVVASTAALAWLAGSSSSRGGAPESPVMVAGVVEERVLAERIELQGIVEAGEERVVGAWTPDGAERSVVTAVFVSPEDVIVEGQVLLEISGRPLVMLTGPVPLFRSLKPLDEGADVRWLQEMLNRAGYRIDVDGSFGRGTEVALRAWYEDRGYNPPPPTEDRVGAWLPIEEVLVSPTATAVVASIAELGSEFGGGAEPAAAIQLEAPHVIARATVAELDSITEGLEVRVEALGSDSVLRGVVESVGGFQPGVPVEGVPPGHDVRIALYPINGEFKPEVGRSVRVVMEVAPAGTVSLAVPITAVREDSTGYFVERVVSTHPDSRWVTEEVRVELGIQSDGWFEVIESSTVPLVEGDELVLGR